RPAKKGASWGKHGFPHERKPKESVAHAGSRTETVSFRWHIASWPAEISSRRGWVTVHGENVESHRGANGQPTISRSSRGGAPGIEMTASSPSRSGVAPNSIRVYGCRGSW